MSINPVTSNLNIQANQQIEEHLENLSLSSTGTESTQPFTATYSLTAEFKKKFRKAFTTPENFKIEEEKNKILQVYIPLEPNRVPKDMDLDHAIALMHADLLFLRFLQDHKNLCTKKTGSLIQLMALITAIKYNHDFLFRLSAIQPAGISLDRLKNMELLFLKCIDWNIGVNNLTDLSDESLKIRLALKNK